MIKYFLFIENIFQETQGVIYDHKVKMSQIFAYFMTISINYSIQNQGENFKTSIQQLTSNKQLGTN